MLCRLGPGLFRAAADGSHWAKTRGKTHTGALSADPGRDSACLTESISPTIVCDSTVSPSQLVAYSGLSSLNGNWRLSSNSPEEVKMDM